MDHSLLIAGRSHPHLAASIAKQANVPMGSAAFEYFPDREIHVQIKDNVRGKDIFVVQSIAPSPNDFLMELLILIDALKRASAKKIIAVIPYFGYARQDRQARPREPITAKLVADLLTTAGAHHILTMDLHAPQIQGFFNIPVDNLYGWLPLVEAIKKSDLDHFVVMAPDLGAIKLAHSYAKKLGVDFAVVDKIRQSPISVRTQAVIGQVEGKNVLIVDDLCVTGQTLIESAKAAKAASAQRIFAACSHAVLAEGVQAVVQQKVIEKFFLTDSIACEVKGCELVSVASLFGEAVKRILLAESVSSIFH